jgi:hypothetical protein
VGFGNSRVFFGFGPGASYAAGNEKYRRHPMEFHKICYDLDVISDLEGMMREFIADVRQRLKLDRPPETRRGANTRDDPT